MHDNTITRTYYIHSQPYGDDYAPFWPMQDERQTVLHYLLCEEPVKVEIDLDTGEWRYLEFAGIKLEKPGRWSGND